MDEPDIIRVKGSSGYIQTRQNSGISGAGIVTPQKSENNTNRNGLIIPATEMDGERAAIPCPRVTAKHSTVKIIKKAYTARSGDSLNPSGK